MAAKIRTLPIQPILQPKLSGDVKPKVYIPIKKVVKSLGNEPFFNHLGGIGEVKLKNTARSFEVYSESHWRKSI